MQISGTATSSPLPQSPRFSSPSGSPRVDDTIIQYARAKLPQTFQLIRRGQESNLFKVIEKTFEVLNDLQFQCLPHKYRALGTQHYIASQTRAKAEQMDQLYDEWLEKEQEYIELRLGYSFDELTDKELDLIPLIRQTIFSVLYQEQEELKAQDPFHAFLSIASIDGSKNSGYYPSLMQVNQRDQNRSSAQQRAEKTNRLYEENLKERGYDFAKMSQRDKELVRASQAAFLEARLSVICDESQEMFYENISLQFEVLAAGVKSSSLSSTMTSWEEKRCQQDVVRAKDEADKKWALYAKREAVAFEQLYGYKLKNLSDDQRMFCNVVRSSIYQLIYEEQSEDLPFVSICNERGELNEEYWIDRLNAQARKNRETPIEEPWHFKDFRDYDVVRINTAPPKAKADGITDANRMRITGAVTPDFCRNVLESIRMYAQDVQKKVVSARTSAEVNYNEVFGAEALTLDEKIIYLQNEFCEALAQTHYLRGHTQGVLNKLNIKVVLGEPSLGAKIVQRKTRKSDADVAVGILRKSSGSLFEPKQVPERALLKKSQTPVEVSQQLESPRFDKSCFDQGCQRLDQEIQQLLSHTKSENVRGAITGDEEPREYFNTYAISLEYVSKELNRLICMLQSFAETLQAEETSRLAKRAAAKFKTKNRRTSSIALRPKSRSKLVAEGVAPLRTRSASLMVPKSSMTKVSPMQILRTSVSSPPEIGTAEISPPGSPRASDINPERFLETARLLSSARNLFIKAAEVISRETSLASLESSFDKLTI